MDVNIESNIPLARYRQKTTGMAAVFRKLQKGDSLVLPIEKRASVYNTATRTGIEIATRTISDTEIRLWRTA